MDRTIIYIDLLGAIFASYHLPRFDKVPIVVVFPRRRTFYKFHRVGRFVERVFSTTLWWFCDGRVFYFINDYTSNPIMAGWLFYIYHRSDRQFINSFYIISAMYVNNTQIRSAYDDLHFKIAVGNFDHFRLIRFIRLEICPSACHLSFVNNTNHTKKLIFKRHEN